jgi:hypothetical protein
MFRRRPTLREQERERREQEIARVKKARRFLSDLPLVMHTADEVGLHKTARALNEALRVSGFELAEQIEKMQKEQDNG